MHPAPVQFEYDSKALSLEDHWRLRFAVVAAADFFKFVALMFFCGHTCV
jgi:hypothetical protein